MNDMKYSSNCLVSFSSKCSDCRWNDRLFWLSVELLSRNHCKLIKIWDPVACQFFVKRYMLTCCPGIYFFVSLGIVHRGEWLITCMKPGKHRRSKQRCQDSYWKVHDPAQSFVLCSYMCTMHKLRDQLAFIG